MHGPSMKAGLTEPVSPALPVGMSTGWPVGLSPANVRGTTPHLVSGGN
jgi:hypothetical protein